MVTLKIDEDTFAALTRRAAARGMTIEQWLRSQVKLDTENAESEPPIGQQMMKLFEGIGLDDDESIPELKGEPVRSPEFK